MIATLVTSTALLLAQALPTPKMDLGSWMFLGLAWLFVIVLLVWSFVRVLTSPPGGSKPDAS